MLKRCNHYVFDKEENRYVSLIKQIKKHDFKCKICGYKLHDIDVYNMNQFLRYINAEKPNILHYIGAFDKLDMLKPVPYEYDEYDDDVISIPKDHSCKCAKWR